MTVFSGTEEMLTKAQISEVLKQGHNFNCCSGLTLLRYLAESEPNTCNNLGLENVKQKVRDQSCGQDCSL